MPHGAVVLHPRPRGDPTQRRSCSCSGGGGALGRREGGGLRPRRGRRVQGGARGQEQPRSALQPCPRPCTCRPRFATRTSSSWGRSRNASSARRAWRAWSWSRRTSRSRKACASISRSTPGWAAGALGLPAPTRDVVGVMSHLASAESDPLSRNSRSRASGRRPRARSASRHRATAQRCCASPRRGSTRSGAGSRSTASRRSARIRPTTGSSLPCAGSRTSRWPRSSSRAKHGLRHPSSPIARPGSASFRRYADGFRRDMTGTDVLVEGVRRRVVGTISMDALAVVLDGPVESGTPVTLVGDGVLIEEHARVADTIAYEIATGLNTRSGRARRVAVDG